MGRSPCCSKEGLNRGAWTAMEDKILTDYIKVHGEGQWRNLPKRAGLKRCGKSCRLRWLNYLRPDIKRGNITPDEEELIIRLHKLLGNRWSLIAGRLPGRTDNEIKNYWNTNIGKKLQKSQKKDNDHPNIPKPNSNSFVIRTKATRCTKVFLDLDIPRPEPILDHQLVTTKLPDDDEPKSSENVPNINIDPISNFMMTDLVLDENFLSEFLSSDFSQQQLQQGDHHSYSNYTEITISSPISDQSLFFSTDHMMRDYPADHFTSMASLMDSDFDWLHDQDQDPSSRSSS